MGAVVRASTFGLVFCIDLCRSRWQEHQCRGQTSQVGTRSSTLIASQCYFPAYSNTLVPFFTSRPSDLPSHSPKHPHARPPNDAASHILRSRPCSRTSYHKFELITFSDEDYRQGWQHRSRVVCDLLLVRSSSMYVGCTG